MEKYIKIKKKYVIILSMTLIFICGIVGYYTWCAYHPEITIHIKDGGTGKEGIKIEAPHIAIAANGVAEPAASIELKLNNIVMQHEFLCQYVRDTYQTSDIKLDMEVKDNQTILKYYGTATTSNGQSVDFEKEFNCDFGIEANIIDSL